ncbi:MAG TPA: pilus assembly protein TadG-related protein [Candidatus Limnocylindrales bacterium]|nr:pilus assembly protein TadG-related protein [Candidatus Limnocylindrales bacterium]
MATMTRRREGGQILVLFTLAAVAVIAMVGLVLDGGSTFAQRRDQQNATDAAALAAANTYLLTTSETQATAAATSTAAANGFTDGNDGTSISVAYDYTSGVMVSVGIQALHPNAFTPVVGIDAWTVSTTSTAQAGFPDMAYQATPFMGSIHVFDNNGDPLPQYSDPDNPFAFNDSNGDVPQDVSDIAWTNYGTGNLDTTTVENMIKGSQVVNVTLDYGDYIGQHNNGNHTTLYQDVAAYMVGDVVPVPIVDDNGNFQGWATFHITGADAGSVKHVYGYYEKGFTGADVALSTCAFGACPRYLGTYVLKLIN